MISIAYNHPCLRFSEKLVQRVLRCVYKGEGGKTLPKFSIVFTDAQRIRVINKKFLQHPYSTDIITFDLSDDSGPEAELYINLDAARSQAREYNVPFTQETQRLLIHGALHLLGYRDATPAEQRKIHEREDYYLTLLNVREG